MSEIEKIKRLIQKQEQHQREEWDRLYKQISELRDPTIKREILLQAFLKEKLPSIEDDFWRRKLFEMSPSLQSEFQMLLVKHGLLKIR
jgi:hypothetical protein